MSKQAFSATGSDQESGHELMQVGGGLEDASRFAKARPIPRISIQAFCENVATAEVLQSATGDRRLAKSHVSVHMGGAPAAVAHYHESPTPNLIIVETTLPRPQMLSELDRLAQCCDAGTKVVVIGHTNDVLLYRELLKRRCQRVSDRAYRAAVADRRACPTSTTIPIPIRSAMSSPSSAPRAASARARCATTPAWAMSEILKTDVVVADLDLAVRHEPGSTSTRTPIQGIAEALQSPERSTRCCSIACSPKCSERLSIFARPVVLDRDYEISADACDIVLDIVRQNVPFVAVDLPHSWSRWVKRVLLQADEVVVTAVPDLANLRNAKNLIDLLKQSRSNDGPPRLVINMAKTPKRPEISAREFSAALDLTPSQIIEFDSETFGLASNNGQMIEEFSAKAKSAQQFRELALLLAHRREQKDDKKKPSALAPFAPILEKLKLKR
jgi:pilus assembly protein CpaE